MYFEQGGKILAADSADGVEFAPPVVVLEARSTPMDDVAVGGPGVAVVETPIGRIVERVYFESRRSDGTTTIGLAATADGITYDVYEGAIVDVEHPSRPAPRAQDARATLLHLRVPFLDEAEQRGALIGAITPGDAEPAPY
jgi:hypothetical protein